MTFRVSRSAAAISALLACLYAPAALALDCAVPTGNDPAVTKEVTATLAGGAAFDDFGRLQGAIAGLTAKGLSRTTVVDALIAAYCPRVAAESNLSEAQKTTAVRAFAARVTQIAYAGGPEDAVILDVPFAPATVQKIDAAAKAEGMTPEAWIAKAVEEGLD
jgi:hypothetical protein